MKRITMNREDKLNTYDYKLYDKLFEELNSKDLFYKVNDDLLFFIDEQLYSYHLIPLPILNLTIPFVALEECNWDIHYFNDDDYKGYIVKDDTEDYRILMLDEIQSLYAEVLNFDDDDLFDNDTDDDDYEYDDDDLFDI